MEHFLDDITYPSSFLSSSSQSAGAVETEEEVDMEDGSAPANWPPEVTFAIWLIDGPATEPGIFFMHGWCFSTGLWLQPLPELDRTDVLSRLQLSNFVSLCIYH